mmetsp:Transcript_12214/g.19189  ORF Transcript_12214/g.19189 Transcript_12214/m.19189 type:complete len:264 (+) Transcript_12214:82-873(+)
MAGFQLRASVPVLVLFMIADSFCFSPQLFGPAGLIGRSTAKNLVKSSESTRFSSWTPKLGLLPLKSQLLSRASRASSTRMVATDQEAEGGVRLELTLGELCKTLVQTCKTGTLCTTLPIREDVDGLHRFGPQSQATVDKWERDGKEYPFGTLVSYLLNEKGQPYMLLAKNAAHTRNIGGNPKVAMYVQDPASSGQKGARVSLVGEIQEITDAQELKDCKEFYADRFPEQAQPIEVTFARSLKPWRPNALSSCAMKATSGSTAD